ncbi:MAG: 50S ribosomal protein L6, partial [Clostridiales bacterium]|nr:50S ribosomal protein L6 [Clostridiales bacterium]
MPITLPAGVAVTVGDAGDVKVKGPKGELSYTLLPGITAEVKEGVLT